MKLFKAFPSPLKSSILALYQVSQLVDRQRCCSKEVFPRIADVTVQLQPVEVRPEIPLFLRPAGHVLLAYVRVRHLPEEVLSATSARRSVECNSSLIDPSCDNPTSICETCSKPTQSKQPFRCRAPRVCAHRRSTCCRMFPVLDEKFAERTPSRVNGVLFTSYHYRSIN